MTVFLSKSAKLTLEVREVFLGYSYEMALFHPDILKKAILIKKRVIREKPWSGNAVFEQERVFRDKILNRKA